MNDRIRELMEQASSNACYDEPGQLHLMNDEIEKFAELIVRECIDAAEEAQADFYVVNNIKTRFGIEEEHDELPSYDPDVDG